MYNAKDIVAAPPVYCIGC